MDGGLLGVRPSQKRAMLKSCCRCRKDQYHLFSSYRGDLHNTASSLTLLLVHYFSLRVGDWSHRLLHKVKSCSQCRMVVCGREPHNFNVYLICFSMLSGRQLLAVLTAVCSASSHHSWAAASCHKYSRYAQLLRSLLLRVAS